MANKIISNLDQLSDPQGTDILPITDVSDPTGSFAGTTKRVSLANVINLANIGNLRASNNLSDLSNASTAQTNLGLGSLATQSSIDGTAITSTGETGGTKFLREDGDGTCSFQEPSVDVDTPLNTALRGTDNPHIGVYPNQSLRVIDNPSKSVAVISDADGNLDFVVKTNSSKAYLNTPSGRLELTTGVSVVEDSTEPDIEITTTSGTYSLISGDSDALGANGLPLQQGFNHPDIGANVAPLLISGGTIS
jgi:hypothetical protein